MHFSKRLLHKLTPFHHAFPVYDLEVTRSFYKETLACPQGREAKDLWIDFDLFGHQIVAHKVPLSLQNDHKEMRNLVRNHVDGHQVPIPHFGVVLEWDQMNDLVARLKKHKIKFEIEPYVRFQGLPGEQQTMVRLEIMEYILISAS